MHIYRYENELELAVLHQKAEPIGADEVLDQKVIDEMFTIMFSHNGIGLAAPQVGISKRFFIIEIDKGKPYVFINPEIIHTSTERISSEEGCLSLPGLYTDIERYATITVQAEDRYRKRFKVEAKGLLAMCIQHEYDHLNGVLHIENVSDVTERERLIERYLRKNKAKVLKRVKK